MPMWVLSRSARWFGFYFSSESVGSLEHGLVVMTDNAVCHIALAHNGIKYFMVITASAVFFIIIRSFKFIDSLKG